MEEILALRDENSKIYNLGGGRRQLVAGGGIQHYKDNYASLAEAWKEVELTIVDGRIIKAPYELIIDNKKITFIDKKTGEVSTLELIDVKPPELPFQIIPFNTGVHFRHILPADKIPFEAQFRLTGKAITRAFDDEGALELETSLAGDVLTEKLSQVKDRITGQTRPAKGNIRIDPTLTVQPSTKDNCIYIHVPDSNYGSQSFMEGWGASDISRIARSLVEFSISSLPAGATLNTATLQLYYYVWAVADPVGLVVWAYKLTRTIWLELESTWNSYATGSAWTAPGADYVTVAPVGGSTTVPAVYGWMSWNVLAIVQDAYNAGNSAEFLVRYETEAGNDKRTWWRTRDYVTDPTLQPKLSIDFSVSPKSGSSMAARMIAAGII